jgi:hypothetical protein
MNKSIFTKNQFNSNYNTKKISTNLVNELSETSSAFMSNINTNFNMKGGSLKSFMRKTNDICDCKRCLNAFNNNNIDLALEIIDNGNCCCSCTDSNGNTIFHHLICHADKDICKEILIDLLSNSRLIGNCINIQNNKGNTLIMLAIINGHTDIANILDDMGADKSIKNNEGKFIMVDDSDRSEMFSNMTDNTVNNNKYTNTILKLFDIKFSPDNEFTSLNLDINSMPSKKSISRFTNDDNNDNADDNIMEYFKKFINFSNTNNLRDSYTTEPVLNMEILSQTKGDTDVKPVAISDKYTDFLENLSIQSRNSKKETKEIEETEETEETEDFLENLLTSSRNNNKKTEVFDEVVEPCDETNTADFFINEETSDITTEKTNGDNETADESEDFLNLLKSRYSQNEEKKITKKSQNDRDVFSEEGNNLSKEEILEEIIKKNKNKNTTQYTSIGNIIEEDEDDDNDSLKTAEILKAIEKINNDNTKQYGGYKENIVGYRNYALDSNISDSEIINSYSNNSKNNNYSDLYNSDNMSNESGNELSRMLNSQKNKLHEQVLDMITSLLNKGELVNNSVPIVANEKNAKLIKAHIYKHISENNKQLGGLDKIILISKMNDQSIIDMVKKMPDLSIIEKSIEKHLAEKKANKSSSNKSSKKYNVSDSSLDFNTSTTESEKPKKSKSSKKSSKSSKSSKSAKPKAKSSSKGKKSSKK